VIDTLDARPRSAFLLALATVLAALGFLLGPVAGTASAQSDPCAIEQFVTEDGEIDIASYTACVAAQNAGQGGGALARTGSDAGMYLGVGAGLVAIGCAFVWTSRRQRSLASVSE
jgi:hypothetical protein